MGELGATLEDGGYLPDEDPDDDPDPDEPGGTVISVDFGKKDHDPAVETWQEAMCRKFREDLNRSWNRPLRVTV